MKKLLSIMFIMLILVGALVSCAVENNSDIYTDTNNNSNINSTDTSTNTQGIVDSSIKVEYNPDKELQDNEFPFDNIVIERSGYDIVAAGKYYGNDFDNIKYYGSYYRIIDNYDDFSELTQWGQKVGESIFDSYFVLVLHTYKNQYVYYSYLDEKGEYMDFEFDTSSNNLKLRERWVWDRGPDGIIDSNGNEIELPMKELNRIEIPANILETIYLLIPKDELPSKLPINGEIELKTDIVELE